MKLVRQTNRYNCGSACLAMILDMTLEDVEELLLRRRVGDLLDPEPPEGQLPQIGVSIYEMMAVFWDLGIPAYAPMMRSAEPTSWYDRVHDEIPVLRALDRVVSHFTADGAAILGVPSLRHPGGAHWIVANGPVFLDPCGTETPAYRSYDDFSPEHPLMIDSAILIGDFSAAHPLHITEALLIERP